MSETLVRELDVIDLDDPLSVGDHLVKGLAEAERGLSELIAGVGEKAVRTFEASEQAAVAAEVGPVAVEAAARAESAPTNSRSASTSIRTSRALMGGYDGQRTFGWTKPRRLYGIPLGR